MRTCRDCGHKEYHPDDNTFPASGSYCRRCVSDRGRAYYYRNRETILARLAERRAANPEHFRNVRLRSEMKDPARSRERHRRNTAAYRARKRGQMGLIRREVAV